MVKFCFVRLLLPAAILYHTPSGALSQTTSPDDYFRSVNSGLWSSVNTWESSSDGTVNWIPATIAPASNANTVSVRNSHTVTINNNTTVDQVVIQSGGVLELATVPSSYLTINDGAGNDISIQNGGIFRHNVASGSQVPVFTGSSTLEVQSGGILEVTSNNGVPSDYANANSTISGNVLWGDGSIFNWNNSTSPPDGVTYFPSASPIAVFRVSKPISFGNTTPTVISGLLEANATVSLSSTGTKNFRNGITGTATVAATAINGGQILINGTTANLGGGALVLNNNGLVIGSGTVTTMISNKSINNISGSTGGVTVSGTLICDEYQIDGNSKIQIDGTVKTTNTNGLTGGANTTFAAGFTVNSLGAASAIDYNRPGSQTVTPLSYANLTISGSGIKSVTAAADVFVSQILNISAGNTFALNGTNHLKLNGGGTLNINANAIFDNGGESQVSGGGAPTINIYGTFITRDAQGFAGTNTSIPGATSTPSITLNIYTGSTVEYGRAGDQAVSSRNDYYNITFSGSGIKTIPTCTPPGTVTIRDNVIADASNKTFGDANTNLTMTGGRLKVGGTGTSPDMGGTYNLTGGDIEFTNSGATAQTIRSPRNYFNIIISGSNVKNGAGTITLVSGGSFTVKTGGIYDNNSSRIDGSTGTQTFTMEGGSTFKTGVPAGFSGSVSIAPFPALNAIESLTIHPKSTIIYSRSGDQIITPLSAYPTLLLKGSGIKTVTTGTVDVATTADSIVVDPLVVFKVSSGAKANFNNRPVFIHSNTSGTGAIGEIADGPAALLNVANVTFERYIPAKRAFRFMSSPVTTTTSIKANWMEGQNNPPPAYSVNNNSNPGYGTHITGSADANDGFDATVTNNPSLFTYNNSSQTWVPAPNTSSIIQAGFGYRLMVRGSRSADLSNNEATPSNTILRTTGSLLTGTVVYNTGSNPSINGNNDSYSLIGNPYPSPVDWDALAKPGLSPYYYAWDPNINTRGAYVAYGNGISSVPASQVNRNIQSSQAFFVQAKGANPSLTFAETNKTTTQRSVFRASAHATNLTVQLLLDNTVEINKIADGVTVLFGEDFTAGIGNEDAGKISNLDESMSIVRYGMPLSIEGRPLLTSNDTIYLQMLEFRQNSYYLKFRPNNFPTGVTAFLKDTYSNKETEVDLSAETLLPFTLTSDSASFDAGRFVIIFKSAGVLPVMISDLKAFKKEAGIQVEWKAQAEAGIERYEVEKSATSLQFEKGGTVAVKTNRSVTEPYRWNDANVHAGNNFYRIKCIEKTGTTKYSNVVSVNISVNIAEGKEPVTVFPNPVEGNTMNVRINGLEKTIYTIAVYDNLGHRVYAGVINHNGTVKTYHVIPGKVISRGSYKLQISNGDKTFTKNVQFE